MRDRLCGWRSPAAALGNVLARHVDAKGLRRLDDLDVFLVHTASEPAEIRDWLLPRLGKGVSALVLEFEKWSLPADWLLARVTEAPPISREASACGPA